MFGYLRLAAAAAAAALLPACLYGFVNDADTTSVITGVKVVADGNCSGSGCGNPVVQYTDTNGRFVFDAYGNMNGSNNVQIVMPKGGQEAVRLIFSKSGYQSRVVYHQPKYSHVTYQGEEYDISNVQTVYLCKLGAPDSDGDGVCNAAEARYGTNPFSSDTDGDSISDNAELFGSGGVDLRYFGVDPCKKDVLVEIDYYPNRKPTQGALDKVTAAFAAAPLSNPDGTTGVNLHLVLDDLVSAADADADLNPVWTDFDKIKNKYFAPRRAPFFHYLVFANNHSGGTSSGQSRGIPAHDFVVTLGGWLPAGGTELQQAGTLMHELGHNLGLQHGGNEGTNYKPNYLSVMSYTYQVYGLKFKGNSGVLDYSRLRIGAVSEWALNEVAAFSPLAPTTEVMLADYGVKIGSFRTGTASANLDINNNGSIQAGNISYDCNSDGDTSDTFNASQNDWQALIFDGANTIGDANLSADAVAPRAAPFIRTPELTEPCLTAP